MTLAEAETPSMTPACAVWPERNSSEKTRARILAVTHEYGTTFLLTAGLMNILLILDVFDLGIGRKN